MKTQVKASELLAEAMRRDTAVSSRPTDWSIEEIGRVKRELDRLIRYGNRPENPREWGSYPAICHEWRWNPEYREQYNAVVCWMLGITTECAGRVIDPCRGLWFVGNPGTGKSSLMRGIRNFCSLYSDPRSGNLPRHMAWRHAKDIVSAYEQEGSEVLDRLSVDIGTLVIDDLGSEDMESRRYGNIKNCIEEILSRRYDRGPQKMTMVTTNLSMDQIRQCYRDRIYDRVREMFNILEFPGTSHRKSFNPDM